MHFSKIFVSIRRHQVDMLAPNKFARHETVELKSVEDPDELQMLDECDSRWVEAWKAAARQLNKLKVIASTESLLKHEAHLTLKK
jgi:hypothetical protein